MSNNQKSSEQVVITPDMVREWLKSKRVGPDPRGPVPDNPFDWRFCYDEQKWVKYLNNNSKDNKYKFPT